tara:strand:+ start:93 stop:1370 length:1278 start_codon:yes stop_codon:yes gene_type:complete
MDPTSTPNSPEMVTKIAASSGSVHKRKSVSDVPAAKRVCIDLTEDASEDSDFDVDRDWGDLAKVQSWIGREFPEADQREYLKRFIRSVCRERHGEASFTNAPEEMRGWIKRCQFKFHPCRTLKKYGWTSACMSLAGEIESDRSAVSVGSRRQAIGKRELLILQRELGKDLETELHTVTAEAGGETAEGHVLVIKGFLNAEQRREVTFELQHIHPDFIDDKMWSHGKCKQKRARTNSNIGFFQQRGSIEAELPKDRKSSIVPYGCMPACADIKDRINRACSASTSNGSSAIDMVDLNTELNFYEDDGGIGNHQDCERSFVIGISLGASRKFQLTPFKGAMPVGDTTDFTLHSGDCYIMDTVAKGNACTPEGRPLYNRLHFRHCAGGGNGKFLRKMWMSKAAAWSKRSDINAHAQQWIDWATQQKSR